MNEKLIVERSQFGKEMRSFNGEAGNGVYAHLPSKALRNYYTSNGEQSFKIELNKNEVIDLTQSDNLNQLLNFAKTEINKNAKDISGYIKPKVNKNNIQRYGRIIELFIKQVRPWAKAWIVSHSGPNIPTGKQVVITDKTCIIAITAYR